MTLTSRRADDRAAQHAAKGNGAEERTAAVLAEVLRTGGKVVPGIRHVAVSVVGHRKRLRSVASVRLSWADRVLGALTVYSEDAEPVPEAVLEFAQAFAAQCSATLACARKADQMEVAMLTRQQIGQAVGVLMERFELSPEAAFSYLRRVSQTRNVKLREVARNLVNTGALPLVAAEGDEGAR